MTNRNKMLEAVVGEEDVSTEAPDSHAWFFRNMKTCGLCGGMQNLPYFQIGKLEYCDCPACNHWGVRFAGKGNDGVEHSITHTFSSQTIPTSS
jgi:hypothetical protein